MAFNNSGDPRRQEALHKHFGKPQPLKNESLNAVPRRNNIYALNNKRPNHSNKVKKPEVTPHYSNQPRPDKSLLTKIAGEVHSLNLPEKGSFNAGLAPYGDDKYVMVYRPDEMSFVGCLLDRKFKLIPSYFHKFPMRNVADPRILWINEKKLLMTYSAVDNFKEFIGGSVIMDLDKSPVFVDSMQFRISPSDIEGRQKNWMPFVHEEKVYLIASVCPHIIYELSFYPKVTCKKVYETPWTCPWPIQMGLRGNTNAILLDDGNYLATFHTSQYNGNVCHYDNGCYIFEGKPPFKVLKCSNRTYLPADAAVQPYFRKAGIIKCVFPVGLVKEGERIIISYGDNDSIVKILDTNLNELTNLMIEV
jgi:predicted GH43/DUF377 family glycosyl hydrolase